MKCRNVHVTNLFIECYILEGLSEPMTTITKTKTMRLRSTLDTGTSMTQLHVHRTIILAVLLTGSQKCCQKEGK